MPANNKLPLIRPSTEPRSGLRRKRPSASRREASRPFRSSSALISFRDTPGSPPWNFTRSAPLASPTRKKAASSLCNNSRVWATPITLSGTSRKVRRRPANVTGRSPPFKKSSSARRRIRQERPTFKQGKLPSRHQRYTVTGVTPRYPATSSTSSNSPLPEKASSFSPISNDSPIPHRPQYFISYLTFTVLSCTMKLFTVYGEKSFRFRCLSEAGRIRRVV